MKAVGLTGMCYGKRKKKFKKLTVKEILGK